MDKDFNIQLIGLSEQEAHIFREAYSDMYDIHEAKTFLESKINSNSTTLVIFNHILKEQTEKILAKSIPAIAVIDSEVEPDATRLSLLEYGLEDVFHFEMSSKERVARCNRVIESYLKINQKIILQHGLRLDKNMQVATYLDKNLNLSKIEFEILYTLFENFKVLIAREKIAQSIWESTKKDNLNIHLANIRKKLQSTPVKIVSQRGQGIKLEVKAVF